MQLGNMRHQIVLGDVVEEFALDLERPPGELDLDLAVATDVRDAILEKMRDMRGIGRRRNGDDRFCLRNLAGGGEDGGAAKAVADEDRGSLSGRAQMIG